MPRSMAGGAVSVYDIMPVRFAVFALSHMPVMPPGVIVMCRGTVMDSNWPLALPDSRISNALVYAVCVMLDTAISPDVSLRRMPVELAADSMPLMFTVSKPEVVLYRADLMEYVGRLPTYVIAPVMLWAFAMFQASTMPLGRMVTCRGRAMPANVLRSVELSDVVNDAPLGARDMAPTGISEFVLFSLISPPTTLMGLSLRVTFRMPDVTLYTAESMLVGGVMYVTACVRLDVLEVSQMPVTPPGSMVTWRGGVSPKNALRSAESRVMVNDVWWDVCDMVLTGISELVSFSLILPTVTFRARSLKVTFRMPDVTLYTAEFMVGGGGAPDAVTYVMTRVRLLAFLLLAASAMPPGSMVMWRGGVRDSNCAFSLSERDDVKTSAPAAWDRPPMDISADVSLRRIFAWSAASRCWFIVTASTPEVMLYTADSMEGGSGLVYDMARDRFAALELSHMSVVPFGIIVM